jgi:virginiamycin B lyase
MSGLSAPATAGAVRISQHPIAKLEAAEVVTPANTIFNGPQGLLVAGVRKTAYQTVTTSPSFAVNAGAGVNAARDFFLGPDRQTWFIGGVSKLEAGTSVIYSTLNEVTPGGAVVRFTFPTPASQPLFAATGPDGAIWLPDLENEGAVQRLSGQSLSTVAMRSGSAAPAQIVQAFGSLWTTDFLTSSIARITPPSEVTEVPLPGLREGIFGFTEPAGITAAPDAVWFTEQNGDAIGRITPTGEVQTFTIPATAGALPGGVGYPSPRDITVGPEDAIWFTDPGTNSIGRWLNGQITEFPIPGPNLVVPEAIVTAGSELWFTEGASATLGSVNPALPPFEEVAPTAKVSTGEVARMLGVHTRISTLLSHKGYTTIVSLPAPGRVLVKWSVKHSTVASGHVSLGAAGTAKLRIVLTKTGTALLRKAKALNIAATATATLAGAEPVSVTRRFVVRRH